MTASIIPLFGYTKTLPKHQTQVSCNCSPGIFCFLHVFLHVWKKLMNGYTHTPLSTDLYTKIHV